MIHKEKEILGLFCEYDQKELDFIEYKKIKSLVETIDQSRIGKTSFRTKCCVCKKDRELAIKLICFSEPRCLYEKKIPHNFLFYSPYFSLYDVFDNVLSTSMQSLRRRYEHEIKRSTGDSFTEAQRQFLTLKIDDLINNATKKLKDGKLAVCHSHEKIKKVKLIEEMIFSGELDAVEIDGKKIIGLK